MYLMDERYETAVAFIVGLAWADDGRPLEGFRDWVADRLLGRRSTRGWWSVIRDSSAAGSSHDAAALSLLLDLLEEFLGEAVPPTGSSKK